MKFIFMLYGVKIYADTDNERLLGLINRFLEDKLKPELKMEKQLEEEIIKNLNNEKEIS